MGDASDCLSTEGRSCGQAGDQYYLNVYAYDRARMLACGEAPEVGDEAARVKALLGNNRAFEVFRRMVVPH